MPEEIMIIVVVSVLAASATLLSIAKMWFNYLNQRSGISRERTPSSSLTTSELEAMLRRISRQANEPLLERIEQLETRLHPPADANQLPERAQTLLDDPAGTPDLVAVSSPGKKVSQK
jgi:hypothetical protein